MGILALRCPNILPPVIAKGYANVGNVGVQLWQSRAICLRAFARTPLSFPRPPLQWRGTGTYPSQSKVPLCGGVARSAGVVTIIESNVPERYHTRMPTATTGPCANIVCVGGSVGGGGVAQSTTGGGNILSPTHARGQQLHPIPWRTPRYIHMCQWRLYRIHPQAHTLCTTRPVMKSGNCSPYRRTYIHWDTCCPLFPYTIPQPQRIQRDTTWTVRRQMRQ